VLLAGFEVKLRAVFVHRLRIVAEALDAVGDFDEGSEAGHAQHFSVDNISHAMLDEESLPDIGLQLLDAQ
jgi:hypothetical protein